MSWMGTGTLGAIVALCGTTSAQPGGDLQQPVGGAPAELEAQPPAMAPEQQSQQPQQPSPPQLDPQNAPTRATFVSTSEQQWDVWVDRQPMCATPCTLGLTSLQYVALRTQERNPIRLDVGYVPQGDVMVSAKPLSNGIYATGIVFTTFSGMALATGITLTAVGWGTDRDGMRTAGLITGLAGGIGLYGSIYLMRKALPKFSVGPARPYVAGHQVGLAGSF